jgi:homoserine/homoserine lactone efflux protein
LFAQLIDPAAETLPQLVVHGGTDLVVDGIILLAWRWLAQSAASRVPNQSSSWVNRVCGALMVSVTMLLASKDINAQNSRWI